MTQEQWRGQPRLSCLESPQYGNFVQSETFPTPSLPADSFSELVLTPDLILPLGTHQLISDRIGLIDALVLTKSTWGVLFLFLEKLPTCQESEDVGFPPGEKLSMLMFSQLVRF